MDKSLRGSHLKLNLPHRCYFNTLFWRINWLKLKAKNNKSCHFLQVKSSQKSLRNDSSWYSEGFLCQTVPEWKLCRKGPDRGHGPGGEGGLFFIYEVRHCRGPFLDSTRKGAGSPEGLRTTSQPPVRTPLPTPNKGSENVLLFWKISKSCLYVTVSKAYIVQFEI